MKCAHLLYLQEELTVFIAMLEYYILSIKKVMKLKKKKEEKKSKEREGYLYLNLRAIFIILI
jgi:hypothetical protein